VLRGIVVTTPLYAAVQCVFAEPIQLDATWRAKVVPKSPEELDAIVQVRRSVVAVL
jgi:hypothetical protein